MNASGDTAHSPPLKRRSVRIGLAAGGVLLVYALVGFAVLPWLAQRQLPPIVAEQFGLELDTATLRFNPFTLRSEARDVRLSLPDGTRLFSADRLEANLEWIGLITRRWTLAAIEIERPHLELLREADGRFVLPQLRTQDEPAAPAEGEESTLPGLRLVRFALIDGRITVRTRDDQYAPVTLTGIALEGSELATGADDAAGSYRLAFELPGGGTLVAQGSLATAARSSEGSIALADTDVNGVWPLVARDWTIAPPQGRLSASAEYRAAPLKDGFDLTLEQLALGAEGLHVARPDSKTAMLALQEGSTRGGRFSLAERQLLLPELQLREGELSLQVDAEGQLDWAALRRDDDEPPEDEDSAPWRIELPDARLEALVLHYRELADEQRRLDVARVDAHGSLYVDTGEGGVRLEGLGATLITPRFAGGDASPLMVERIALENGRVDTARRALEAERLLLSGSRADLTITPDGTLQLPGGLVPQAAQEGRPTASADGADESWSYALGQLVIENVQLGLDDQRAATPVKLQAKGGLLLSKVASGGDAPMGLEAQFDLASGGRLRVDGQAAQDGSTLQARLRVDGVELSPARALVEAHTTLRLVSGKLGGDLKLNYDRAGAPQMQAEGHTRVDDIRFEIAESGESLFAARSVTADGALQLGPDRLTLSSVVLDHPEARLQVDADRQFNLAQIAREREATAPESPSDPDARFPLRIEKIGFREATVDFSDESLILPFSTQITRLNGALHGVDNSEHGEAVIDARGFIEPHGEARAEGRLRPFDLNQLTDVSVNFDNVEMSSLSPYSATFAGRKIARGRLWLAVRYRVFDEQLDGSNAVTLEEFELGERVDSPGAMDLPLELALALLRDPDGRVHLEVPVRGDVSDARFEYGAVVRSAIGNVLTRAVTAPFRLLAGLVGGGDDDSLQDIGFEAGSDRLAPPQQEKLQRLAEALQQRPQLRLTLQGTFVPEGDDRALRTQALRGDITQSTGTSAEGGSIGQLDFSNGAIRRAVADRYERLTGPNALSEFRREFARGPDAGNETALHRALFDRLLQNQPLAADGLKQLAERRSEAVQSYLTEHGIEASRLEARPPERASGRDAAGVKLEIKTN